MLDRAGDRHRHVELGRHGLAGLPHLVGVRAPARVHHGARGSHRGAERLRQALDEVEILRALQAPPSRYDDLRLGQIHLAALLRLDFPDARLDRRRIVRELERAHRGLRAPGRGGSEHLGPQGNHRGRLLECHRLRGLAGIDRSRGAERPALHGQRRAIGGEPDAELGGDARRQISAHRRAREERHRGPDRFSRSRPHSFDRAPARRAQAPRGSRANRHRPRLRARSCSHRR